MATDKTKEVNNVPDAKSEQLAGTYLTFGLGEELYGLPILKVQEIIGTQEITKVPRVPSYVKGVINLRGKVVPVVDLRLKFSMEEQEITRNTCIIILYVSYGDTEITMGIMVDNVSEVIDFHADRIEPPPEFGTQINTDFILGLGKKLVESETSDEKAHETVVMLLDVDRILTTEELNTIAAKS